MSAFWKDTLHWAQVLRHELHTHPELGWQEQRTAGRVRELLTELDIPWRTCAQTGTVATLNAGAAGRHIALRGDMDALPIEEQTGRGYASQNPGCMHACGHDGHTATLLATARWLKECESDLPGPVTLLFQPAEEGGHGAREMIRDGALEGVDAVYGWHNWPAIGYGKLLCPEGIVMCGNGTFTLTLTGQGGHASQPELCRDPVLAGSAVVQALQQIVSRRMPPQKTCVVSVTSIEAPSAPTVIPQKAVIGGSIRVPDRAVRDQVNQLIDEIATRTAHSYGVDCEVAIHPRYDATINHSDEASRARQAWQSLYGAQALESELPLPVMASEDFSYYLQTVPGAFALIGADDEQGPAYPCHSPYYDFNDRLIGQVVRWYAQLVGAPLPP